MKKRYTGLLISLLAVVVLLFSGCITIYDESPQDNQPGSPAPVPSPASGTPIIKSFTADQVSINPGQQVNLSWEVSGANEVEINPVVGPVGQLPANVVMVSPVETTTYTLTATNEAGSSSAMVTVTVVPVAANRADLIVTDISIISKMVNYTVKNVGGDTAPGCRAYLYVNGGKETESYIEALAPGEERTMTFSNYTWLYEPGGLAAQISESAPRQFAVKVCADVQNAVVEGDEGNNCKTVIVGEKINYRFADYAHMARWYTGAGALVMPVPESNVKGYAGVQSLGLEDGKGYGSTLVTIPQHVPDGWIKGVFGEFYADEHGKTQMAYMEVFDMTKFTAMVGFSGDTAPSSQAKFIFQVEGESSEIILSQSLTATNDGKLDLFEVDLSSLAGKHIAFILRVETTGSAENIRPAWVDPRVMQP